MTTNIEQLEAEKKRLWNELMALEKPYKAKLHEWSEAFDAFNRETVKAEIRAELLTDDAAAAKSIREQQLNISQTDSERKGL